MLSGGGWLATLEPATAGSGGCGVACVACAHSAGRLHCGWSRASCRSSCGMETSLLLTLPFGRPVGRTAQRGCVHGELLLRPSIQLLLDIGFYLAAGVEEGTFRRKVPSLSGFISARRNFQI
jgi:hypothetical protein